MKPKSITPMEVDSEKEISYAVTFYNRRVRNNFNNSLSKLLQKHNIKYKELCYNEFLLPILEDVDKPLTYQEIKYCFENKEQRRVFIQFVRENMKGYYEAV